MIFFNDDFELKNKSGFINKVVSNYYDKFPLSIDVALKQIASIRETLNGEKFEQKLTRRVIEEVNKEIMKNLIKEYSEKFSSDVQFKLKVNKENRALLGTLEEAQYFDEFAPRSGISFYVKILLESYAVLSIEERERIYFKETIEIVEKAIKNKTVIQFKIENQTLRLTPIEIYRPDYQQSLVLLATNDVLREDKSAAIYNDITLKELSMGQVRELKTKKGLLSDLKHNFTSKTLYETKSQKPTQTFTIKFTPGGLSRFLLEEDRLPFVGVRSKEDEHVYTVKTTETHIFLHLFKYGGQALVISPADVRDRFSRLFKASYEEYEKSKTSEVIG